jgi:predicted O-methyltransferase YrrM
MNTLTSPPVSTLLERLFAEANIADQGLARLSREERASLLASAKTDYRGLYARAVDMFLAISPQTGLLLYMLARASGARQIVEFGTSFGISTLHLAAAVKDNGGGRIIGSELEPHKAQRARRHLQEAGLESLVEIREGDALQTLARDLPAAIQLVLLDGAKVLYPQILALVEPHLAPGALLVADNADHSPEYLARVRGAAGYLSLALGEDVELSQWLGEDSAGGSSSAS